MCYNIILSENEKLWQKSGVLFYLVSKWVIYKTKLIACINNRFTVQVQKSKSWRVGLKWSIYCVLNSLLNYLKIWAQYMYPFLYHIEQ